MSELGKVIENIESCNYECEAGPLTKHVGWHTLIAAAKRAEQAERERDEEAAAHSRTVDERESAVDAITRAYAIVVGESPTWSNRFGYAEALGDIENAFHALRQAASRGAIAND